MTRVRYVGRYSAVVVEVAPERWQTVGKREVVELADRIADKLLEQSDAWQEVKTRSTSTSSGKRSRTPSKAPPADNATEVADNQEG